MTFHNSLMDKANNVADGLIKPFFNSSYHNDACGSIMYEVEGNPEKYVQLLAFESVEQMKAEGFEDLFHVVVYEDGDFNESSTLFTNDEDLAIKHAVEQALAIQGEQDLKDYEESCANGLEWQGVWIDDRMKSPCGRFDLTLEQSQALYGKA